MSKTNSRKSFAERLPKKRYGIIILVIFAVIVGHFGMQMSFITSENDRNIGLSPETETFVKQNIPTKPELVKNNPVENPAQDSKVKKSDVALSSNPLESQENVKTVKVNQKESRQTEKLPVQNSSKKEAMRESRSERIRRAEKILTGF